jgi:TRAP-type mannitol/chloroaromatic compound transport system substrate-binding protein
MNRRSILGAAAAPVALATPALAQTQNPEIRWRLQSSFPKNLDILFFGAEQISRRVAELTDNRFQIRAFSAGEIAPPLQVLDAVQAGTIECGQTPLYYYIGKDPALSFFTSMPFGGNYRQQGAWMKRGGGNEMCAEMLREFNCVGFLCGDTGTQMGGWFRSEVKSLADIQGLKFRIAGLGGRVFQRIGAVPTLVPASDIYPSLERGTIDAAEFVGPYDDEKLGFQRVAKILLRAGLLGALRPWPPGDRPEGLGPAAGRLQGRDPGGLHRDRDRDDGPLRPAESAGAAPAGRRRRPAARLAARRPPGRLEVDA